MISDEAVEAAAGTWQYDWRTANEGVKSVLRERLRAALEAAAPHMLADAWDEGCREGLLVNNGWEDGALDANPYRSQP